LFLSSPLFFIFYFFFLLVCSISYHPMSLISS
jgi:hypothetical protein